jgi:hypothetical protein
MAYPDKKKTSPWSLVVMGLGALGVGAIGLFGAATCALSPQHPACADKPGEVARLSKIGLFATPLGAIALGIGVWELRSRKRR